MHTSRRSKAGSCVVKFRVLLNRKGLHVTAYVFLFAAAMFLAYYNGANDNFKGVATLFGSDVLSYKSAIALATAATLAGSMTSLFVAAGLLKVFSGRGVVPDEIATLPVFLTAVAAGAAGTIAIATATGFPVSTTHGLTGAILGAGFAAVGTRVNASVLGATFFAPLLLSPVLAISLTAPAYRLLKACKGHLQFTGETCLCVGTAHLLPAPVGASNGLQHYAAISTVSDASVLLDSKGQCVAAGGGQLLIMRVKQAIKSVHVLSAVAVSFARGLNDTPKIVALLLVIQSVDIHFGLASVAAAMALGGLLSARKVAHTMSKKISQMSDGQALTANLVTAFLVICASRFGFPVSTTHVSVGAIAGIGLINGTANRKVLWGILLSWLVTLPIAAILAACSYLLLERFA